MRTALFPFSSPTADTNCLALRSAETITTTIQDIYPAVMKKMRVVVTLGLCLLLFLLGLVCVTQVGLKEGFPPWLVPILPYVEVPEAPVGEVGEPLPGEKGNISPLPPLSRRQESTGSTWWTISVPAGGSSLQLSWNCWEFAGFMVNICWDLLQQFSPNSKRHQRIGLSAAFQPHPSSP